MREICALNAWGLEWLGNDLNSMTFSSRVSKICKEEDLGGALLIFAQNIFQKREVVRCLKNVKERFQIL